MEFLSCVCNIISIAFHVVVRNEGILDGLNVVSIEIEMRKPAEEFGCL